MNKPAPVFLALLMITASCTFDSEDAIIGRWLRPGQLNGDTLVSWGQLIEFVQGGTLIFTDTRTGTRESSVADYRFLTDTRVRIAVKDSTMVWKLSLSKDSLTVTASEREEFRYTRVLDLPARLVGSWERVRSEAISSADAKQKVEIPREPDATATLTFTSDGWWTAVYVGGSNPHESTGITWQHGRQLTWCQRPGLVCRDVSMSLSRNTLSLSIDDDYDVDGDGTSEPVTFVEHYRRQ